MPNCIFIVNIIYINIKIHIIIYISIIKGSLVANFRYTNFWVAIVVVVVVVVVVVAIIV